MRQHRAEGNRTLRKCAPNARGASLSHPLLPVARPAMRVCYCKDKYLGIANVVHDAERELVKNVSAATGEIDRPPLGCFHDGRHRPLEFALKIERCSKTAIAIPCKRRKILSVGFGMEVNRLIGHSTELCPCAALLPKESSLPYQSRFLRGDERSLPAMQVQHQGRR